MLSQNEAVYYMKPCCVLGWLHTEVCGWSQGKNPCPDKEAYKIEAFLSIIFFFKKEWIFFPYSLQRILDFPKCLGSFRSTIDLHGFWKRKSLLGVIKWSYPRSRTGQQLRDFLYWTIDCHNMHSFLNLLYCMSDNQLDICSKEVKKILVPVVAKLV